MTYLHYTFYRVINVDINLLVHAEEHFNCVVQKKLSYAHQIILEQLH